MIELYQLEQLLAVAQWKTLSRAAEELHLSQPALSRSMQKLEEELHVTLFERQKNKLTFNENGQLAVEYAKKVTDQLQDMVDKVRAFDRSRRTIAVASCAPSPLWDIVPSLSVLYPEMTISSEIQDMEQLKRGLQEQTYQLIILPEQPDSPELYSQKYGEEQLFFSLPPGHALSESNGLHFHDLDGETMLLHSRIGVWYDMHLKTMPDTHFLLQDDYGVFSEVVKASALPSFTSDIVMKREGVPENRKIIPILDDEAHTTYYCVCLKSEKKRLETFFRRLQAPQ